ncbi:MAG: NACHT domain-containing protein [Crocosphaera sp.]
MGFEPKQPENQKFYEKLAKKEKDLIDESADKNWDLERLFADLGEARKQYQSRTSKAQLTNKSTNRLTNKLSNTQKIHLCGLLCDYSPHDMAKKLNYGTKKRPGGGISAELSKGLYRYIKELLRSEEEGEKKTISWENVSSLLKEYRGEATPPSFADWDCAPDVSTFFGREEQLRILASRIVDDKCRLVAIYGLPEMGKTYLATKLAQDIQKEFQYIIWRSFRYLSPKPPSLETLITNLSNFFSQHLTPKTSNQKTPSISTLINYLKEYRCLIVLDGWEELFHIEGLAGQYQEGFEDYRELLKAVGESNDLNSCLLLTSCEKIPIINSLKCSGQVHLLDLPQLTNTAAKQLLRHWQMPDEPMWDTLIQDYRGNPGHLRRVFGMIHDPPYNGSFAQFSNTVILGDVEVLIDEQYRRLTPSEKKVLRFLAQVGQLVSVSQLKKECLAELSNEEFRKTVSSLERRVLLEKAKKKEEMLYTLQPVMIKYVKTNYL